MNGHAHVCCSCLAIPEVLSTYGCLVAPAKTMQRVWQLQQTDRQQDSCELPVNNIWGACEAHRDNWRDRVIYAPALLKTRWSVPPEACLQPPKVGEQRTFRARFAPGRYSVRAQAHPCNIPTYIHRTAAPPVARRSRLRPLLRTLLAAQARLAGMARGGKLCPDLLSTRLLGRETSGAMFCFAIARASGRRPRGRARRRVMRSA